MGRKAKKTRKVPQVSRGHIQSVAGRVFPPLHVRTPKDIEKFVKLIQAGPMTMVLVFADWCPHCVEFMPHFDAASNQSSRSIQVAKIRDDMVNQVNESLSRLNHMDKTLDIQGYPTIKALSPESVTPAANKEGIVDVPTKPDVVQESMNIVPQKETSSYKGEAEEVTNLHESQSPGSVVRPNQKGDRNVIQDERIQGGSLMGVMAHTAYTMAPPAILLATARAMFGKRSTRSKRSTRRFIRKAFGLTRKR